MSDIDIIGYRMQKRNTKKYKQDGNTALQKEQKQKIMCPKCDSFDTGYLDTEQYDYTTYEFYNCNKCGCEFDRIITTRYEIMNN